jgi:FkbM family methyltransferase
MLKSLRRRLRNQLQPVRDRLLLAQIAKPESRQRLNDRCNAFTDDRRELFYRDYAKVFGRTFGTAAPGVWAVRFRDVTIRIPLAPDSIALDWDTALSVIGHDPEIKRTYAAILDSQDRPAIFLDVGANLGTHSTMMASAGVEVFAFEPNPVCKAYFDRVRALNGVELRWEAVAIGDREGVARLTFPEGETWLGSMSDDIVAGFTSDRLHTVEAPLRRLDSYLDSLPPGPVLMKIDVEGLELQVLQGAADLVAARLPTIIFEALRGADRAGLFGWFQAHGYAIEQLPWRPGPPGPEFARPDFIAWRRTNFMARPRDPAPRA